MSDLVSAAVPEGADQSVQQLLERGRVAGGRVTLHEVFEVLEFDDVSLDRRAEIVELLARHGIELDESEEIPADPIADLASVPQAAADADPTVGAVMDADANAVDEEQVEPEVDADADEAPAETDVEPTGPHGVAPLKDYVVGDAPPGYHERYGDRRLRSPSASRGATEGGSADSVRMYLKEIGRVPLLTGPQEVDLAQRIEKGTAAAGPPGRPRGRRRARARSTSPSAGASSARPRRRGGQAAAHPGQPAPRRVDRQALRRAGACSSST